VTVTATSESESHDTGSHGDDCGRGGTHPGTPSQAGRLRPVTGNLPVKLAAAGSAAGDLQGCPSHRDRDGHRASESIMDARPDWPARAGARGPCCQCVPPPAGSAGESARRRGLAKWNSESARDSDVK
jgi:hypothetical protein